MVNKVTVEQVSEKWKVSYYCPSLGGLRITTFDSEQAAKVFYNTVGEDVTLIREVVEATRTVVEESV